MSRIDEEIKRYEEKLLEKKKKRLLQNGKRKQVLADRILAKQERISNLTSEVGVLEAKVEALEKVL